MSPLAAFLISLLSGATAAWSFRLIVRWYGSPSGFPWIPALLFAAAAITTVLVLNVLIGS